MRKIESIILASCYVFVVVAVVRLCVALVQDQTEFTLSGVLSLGVLFLTFAALLFVAGHLLYSEHVKSQAKRRAKNRTF